MQRYHSNVSVVVLVSLLSSVFFFLSCTSMIPLTQARIETLTLHNDDRSVILISSFGYASQGGRLELTIQDVNLLVPHAFNFSQSFSLAFLLQRSINQAGVKSAADVPDHQCFHQVVKIPQDIYIPLDSKEKWALTTVKEEIKEAGEYHLYFSNCLTDTRASLSLTLTQYNIMENGQKNYLSIGDVPLPIIYFITFAAFIITLVVWAILLWKNSEEVRKIHYLMTAVLVLKCLSVLFDALEYHSIAETGTPHGFNIPFHIFSFLKGFLFFTGIALVGTGWSYMIPFVRDKKIIYVILAMQLIFQIAFIVVDDENQGTEGFATWSSIFLISDMVCCILILFPIYWSMRYLREASSVDGRAASNLDKLERFRKFYLITAGYIYITRIVVFLMMSALPYNLTWLAYLITEISAFAFYVVTGYLFQPTAHNSYLPLDSDQPDEEVDSLDDGGDLELERITMSSGRIPRMQV